MALGGCVDSRMSESNESKLNDGPLNYLVDDKNPCNVKLSACYKRTFAYYSMRKRVPIILRKIIDNLMDDRDAITYKYGSLAKEELKVIISNLIQLKCDILMDKEFQTFDTWSPDQEIWNRSINMIGDSNTFFSSVWIFAECYMYRRIREIFLEQSVLKYYDYFQKHKENALTTQFGPMIMIAKYIEQNRIQSHGQPKKLKTIFENLIKLDLWGNQLDLSKSDGKQVNAFQDPLGMVDRYDSSILVNDFEDIWQCLAESGFDKCTAIVDFVCDNAGYELFIDLCIGDFLLENCLAKRVRFHVKSIPYFISDVMATDFFWTVRMLRTHTDEYLSKIGQRCSDYLQDGRFGLMDKGYFWTTGYSYNRMSEIDAALYKTLSAAQLIIFKGDVNYRKLMGEVNWKPSTPFEDALQGFRPSNLCSLRTVKAEIISGLKWGVSEQLDERNPNWMISGEYGVLQFARKLN